MDRGKIASVVRDELYVAALSDVLDDMGLFDQVLTANIRPLDRNAKLTGFARTGVYREVYHVGDPAELYRLEIALIDDLRPLDVPVLTCGGSKRIGPWGELLSTAAIARRAAGCVTDGYVRDILAIEKLGFPTFHGGISPRDSKGRGMLAEYDVPAEIAGVRVASGDLVVGDADGVVIVPADRIGEAVALALRKVRSESSTRDDLMRGRSLRDVVDEYGVL